MTHRVLIQSEEKRRIDTAVASGRLTDWSAVKSPICPHFPVIYVKLW